MTNTTEDASKLVQGNPLTSPLFRSLVGLTKTAGFLKHSEFAFFRSISSKFDAELPGLQSQVLDLLNASLNASLASKGVPHVTMDSLHDLLENHSALISDALDGLLEKTDVQLDLLTGKRKQKDLVVVPPSVDAPALTSSSRSNRSSSSIILRPQVQFHEKPDNSNRPFVRIIKYKPHAKRPLDYGLPGSTEISDDMESHLESMGITKTSSALFRYVISLN